MSSVLSAVSFIWLILTSSFTGDEELEGFWVVREVDGAVADGGTTVLQLAKPRKHRLNVAIKNFFRIIDSFISSK